MEHFYFLIVLGVVVLLAVLLSLASTVKQRSRLPYRVDKHLFTAPQRAFKNALERALGQDYRIYAKIRVADIIGLSPRLSRRMQDRALERLGERRFDFIVCTAETDSILCAVNLAPRSRRRKPPRKDVLDRICAAAQLSFVRVREHDLYSIAEIEEEVFAAMRRRGGTPKIDEHAAEDTQSMLRDLSEVIDEERRPMHPIQPARARVESRPTAPVRAQRREPIIQDHQVVDEGPTFKFEADLDQLDPQRPTDRAVFSTMIDKS